MSKGQRVLAKGALAPLSYASLEGRLVKLRGEMVLLDADVAWLYGVETRAVNQAVRRNLDKFPQGYFFELAKEDADDLRSQIVIANISTKSRVAPKAFTEKGLYMLATILKSERATAATLTIIETFAKVRELKRELVALHTETDKKAQSGKMKRIGELIADIVMPDLSDVETESSLELNFLIGKIKHTVRRIKRKSDSPLTTL